MVFMMACRGDSQSKKRQIDPENYTQNTAISFADN